MNRRKPTDLAASVRQRLLDISRRTKTDANLIWTRYAVERLLFRLASSEHAREFVLNRRRWQARAGYHNPVDKDSQQNFPAGILILLVRGGVDQGLAESFRRIRGRYAPQSVSRPSPPSFPLPRTSSRPYRTTHVICGLTVSPSQSDRHLPRGPA